MREFLEFTSRRYHIMLKEETAERREQAKRRAEREARKRGTGRKPTPTGEKPPVAVSRTTEPLVGAEDYQGMLTTAQEKWIWCESFLERDGLKESLSKLRTAEDMAKSEVQQRIFQTSKTRRLRFWAQFQLQRPEDIYPLAVFHHKLLGAYEYPAFLISVARCVPDICCSI